MDVISVLLTIYLTGAVIIGFCTFYVTRDTLFYRLLAAAVIGITWPLSAIPFLFSLTL